MTDTAIDRLKNRQRKKVSARNTSLNQSDSNDSLTKSSQTVDQSDSNDSLTKSSQIVEQLDSSNSLTKSSQIATELTEPIRRTVRLDPLVDEVMDSLCKENRITRETLIEAAILISGKNQRILNKVIVEAKDRYKDRKRIGELKKLQTMNRKFGIGK